MQLAASLVEYFVTGCGAILWVVPLLISSPRDAVWTGSAVLLVPLLYAFGMAIDYASNRLLSGLIKRIHAKEKIKLLPDGLSETVFVIQRSPQLGQALELRSTRDRIARGFLFNLVVMTVVIQFRDVSWLWPGGRLTLSIGALGLVAAAFGAWWRFERLTFRFKKHAIRAILLQDTEILPSPQGSGH
jgi:hypothetical protein